MPIPSLGPLFSNRLPAQYVSKWKPNCLEELNYTVLPEGRLTVVQKNGVRVRGKLVSIDFEPSSLTLNPVTRLESGMTGTFNVSEIEAIQYGTTSKGKPELALLGAPAGMAFGFLLDLTSGAVLDGSGEGAAIGLEIGFMGGLVLSSATARNNFHTIRRR